MKVVFGGEWVKTSMLSTRFNVTGLCSKCRRLTAGTVWHSIKSGKTVCMKCWPTVNPEGAEK